MEYAYSKVFLHEVEQAGHASQRAASAESGGAAAHALLVGQPPVPLSYLWVMGVVTKTADGKDGRTLLTIDDGTGQALLSVEAEAAAAQLGPGSLVDAFGQAEKHGECGTVISVHSIAKVHDPNMETARYLEILEFYQHRLFAGLLGPKNASEEGDGARDDTAEADAGSSSQSQSQTQGSQHNSQSPKA